MEGFQEIRHAAALFFLVNVAKPQVYAHRGAPYQGTGGMRNTEVVPKLRVPKCGQRVPTIFQTLLHAIGNVHRGTGWGSHQLVTEDHSIGGPRHQNEVTLAIEHTLQWGCSGVNAWLKIFRNYDESGPDKAVDSFHRAHSSASCTEVKPP